MWKSSVIAEWRAEGRLEGRRDQLVEMVQLRYPNLTPELLERIKGNTDEKTLRRWSVAFTTTPDQAAFEAALADEAHNNTSQE